ncbi:hypothetical protein DCAR_0103284 [Daucus carota subsp. sativus]|uniref:Uncharacterized protein n=1 Tax=Daucus carota subsp. sativus TaxID=79200 RepID=A0A162AL09_DAUCS|nr:PREDICTED: uncharacterized protein LOC108200267 [Daucus carota subsp. sativus]WOG84104.1 hypothetical protein DCAR_0103284 [Daucus carota subsp. sativus]
MEKNSNTGDANKANSEKTKKIEEGLPIETSPYMQYKDLEDYKQKGYGTQGHLEPKPGHGAANSTDAPTDSVSSHAPLPSTDKSAV